MLFCRFSCVLEITDPLYPHEACRLILPLVWMVPFTRSRQELILIHVKFFNASKFRTQTSLLALSSYVWEFSQFSNLSQMTLFFLFAPPYSFSPLHLSLVLF